MAKVLLTWELGGGSGHLVNLRPFVGRLEAAGHTVTAALRNLDKGRDLLGGKAVSYLQSPYKTDVPRNMIPVARTYADILHNVGFGDADELRVRADAWRGLIDSVDPDLIIFEHSPTALLAAWGSKARRVLLGDSFCCPADCSPLPDLRPWLPAEPQALLQREEAVLGNVNRVLQARGQPVMERLGQLFGEVDEVILVTLAEFDLYAKRKEALTRDALTPGPSPEYGRGEKEAQSDRLKTYPTSASGQGEQEALTPKEENTKSQIPNPKRGSGEEQAEGDRLKTYPTSASGQALTPDPSPEYRRGETVYRGPWLAEGGEAPRWPEGSGKRIFAYLKNFPALPHLLDLLRQTGCPTIVHIDGLGNGDRSNLPERPGGCCAQIGPVPISVKPEFAAQHASPTLCLAAGRLDLPRAAAECDLAILNGTHGSTVLMLLAGKPILQIPLVLEQELDARATVRLGAGASVSPGRADALAPILSGMLQSDSCGEAARRFAARYSGHSPREESQLAVAHILGLLA